MISFCVLITSSSRSPLSTSSAPFNVWATGIIDLNLWTRLWLSAGGLSAVKTHSWQHTLKLLIISIIRSHLAPFIVTQSGVVTLWMDNRPREYITRNQQENIYRPNYCKSLWLLTKESFITSSKRERERPKPPELRPQMFYLIFYWNPHMESSQVTHIAK